MERPFPSPAHTKPSRTRAMIKRLKQISGGTTQWAILMVDSKGRTTVETSEVFQDRRDAWFPEHIKKEASDITVAAINLMRERKRSEAEQNGTQSDEKPDDREAGLEDEDFEEDAEHDEEEGINGGLDGEDHDRSSILPKEPNSLPPPPPSLFGPRIPRERKRSLPTTKPQAQAVVKRRRSSVKSISIPKPDPASGESSSVTNGGITYRPLLISDSAAVTTFFETRFRQMQQLTCKVVAKAWIKVIEPKKQSNFPYNRGEESKPSWWPEGARHKEPDHLMKPERLLLLMTMLRCRRVPVTKLEAATAEVAAHIEECRIGLLEEIYRVAKMEERWVEGTLPPSACCFVAASAEKIVSNPKPPSPKPLPPPSESVEVSPTTATAPSANPLGTGLMTAPAASDTDRTNNMDIQSRPTPRQSPTEAPPSRASAMSFPTATRAQSMHTPMNYSPFIASTPASEDGYMDSSQSAVQSYYYRSLSSYGQHTAAAPTLRRANSISQSHISHPQYPAWSMPVYSPYSQTTQQQQASAHRAAHNAHSIGGSNPPTPVTSTSFQSMQMLVPQLPPIHQQQAHNSLGASAHHEIAVSVAGDRTAQYNSSRIAPHMDHQSVSFQEFLESPTIPEERPFDMTGVASAVDDDIVNITGRQESVGMPGAKEMPHG
ncbi:hypothetical protein BDZ91DRAFT_796198 [Kalaharituber pfeilii]|nr:hypothetical protein BDZ91DRAFT_796198 [Kalaharituber pfeilii]